MAYKAYLRYKRFDIIFELKMFLKYFFEKQGLLKRLEHSSGLRPLINRNVNGGCHFHPLS